MDLVSSIRKSGSRGGVNFSWDEVASSTHRENYLGHSLKAPVGRWQKGKDLEWYAKNDASGDGPSDETEEERAARGRREEIKKIKEAEEDALARALGLPVAPRNQTGANAVEVTKARVGPEESKEEEPKAPDDIREAKKHRRHENSHRHHRRRRRSHSRDRERRRDKSPRRRQHSDGQRSRDDRRDQERQRDYSRDRGPRSPRRRDEADSHRRHNDGHRRRSYSRDRGGHKRRHDEAVSDPQGEVLSKRNEGDEYRTRSRSRSRTRQRNRSPETRHRRAYSP